MPSRVVSTEDGPLTLTESVWTEQDRGLVLALLAEQAETCPSCGHPISVCRDPSTIGHWQVIESVCHATMTRQVKAENPASAKRRGLYLGTRLNGGGGGQA